MDLYAKGYLYSVETKAEIKEIVTSMSNDLLSLYLFIINNDNYSPHKVSGFSDGFLFFPYLLKIDVIDSFSTKKYVDDISILLKRLWDNKYPAIIAADFEDLLPEAGGYKSTNVPFPASA